MRWLQLHNTGRSLFKNLLRNGIKEIVIYGASEFAVRLIEEAEKEKYTIVGIVDRKITQQGGSFKGIPFLSINDISQDVYVVVTAMGFEDEIKSELEEKGLVSIMTLQDVIEGA